MQIRAVALAVLLACAAFSARAQIYVTQSTGGLVSLTTGVTGVLPAANGGVDTSAWTSYSPTATCGQATGTITCTAIGRYKTVGKTTHIAIQVTTSGTFTAGTLSAITLPNTSANQGEEYVFAGAETSVTGVIWYMNVGPNVTSAFLRATGGGTTVTTGNIVGISGIYENQ